MTTISEGTVDSTNFAWSASQQQLQPQEPYGDERYQVDHDEAWRRPEIVSRVHFGLDRCRTEWTINRHAHLETPLVIHHER